MKKAHLPFVLIYCVLLYAHFQNIYYLYFEFTNADKVSLAISLIIPFYLAYRFIKTTNRNIKLIGSGLLIAIPLSLHPIISNLLGWSDYTWILMHLLVAIGGISAAIIQAPLWAFLPLASVAWAMTTPLNFEHSQLKYSDKVIAGIDTRKGSGQIVQWKTDYWLHYNGELQFSTIDGHILGEAFIQPVMHLENKIRDVLIVGGDNGLLTQELSKFSTIDKIVIVPYDKDYFDFVNEHNEALRFGVNKKLKVINEPLHHFLADTTVNFDLILIDLPEPKKVEFRQFYSEAFYKLCFNKLKLNGSLVTKTVRSYTRFGHIDEIQENIQSAGFSQLAYHTQIPTLGQYSWIIGSKKYSSTEIASNLRKVKPQVSTVWWDSEAMEMMLSFGKTNYFSTMIGPATTRR